MKRPLLTLALMAATVEATIALATVAVGIVGTWAVRRVDWRAEAARFHEMHARLWEGE